MPKTRADLRTAIRGHTNTENNTGFITDTFLNELIEEARRDLYDIVLDTYQHYYVSTSQSFTLTGSPTGNTTTLPTDFYKDIGLNKDPGTTNERPVDKLGAWQERAHPDTRCYYLKGSDTLVVTPFAIAGGVYQLLYAPVLADMANDSEQLDRVLGQFPLYIELHAGIAAKDKREQDTTSLETRLGRERARVEAALTNRSERPSQAARYRRTTWGYP